MDFSKLLSQIDSVTTKKSYDNDDSEFFRLSPDKAGNATAVIRFLPDANIDEIPFVRRFKHSFKNPANNRWYIEFSLSTIGQNDYIGQVNSELWNSGLEENKEIARRQKRKLEYISNVLVIKDDNNPDNVGKVLKYRYGKKIFDMIVTATKGDDEVGIKPLNPFDPETGANFVLKQKEVSGWPNFDDSKFGPSAPLFNGDQKKIDEVLGKCFNLQDEVAPSKFKTPEELEKKFKWVMGEEAPKASGTKSAEAAVDAEMEELAKLSKAEKPKQEPRKSPPVAQATADDDDDDAFFKDLMDN